MALRHLDLTSLVLFKAVCASGSITHGAHDFGLALGAASRRIAELERHLGNTLLVRSKSGVRPTAAGNTLLEHIERLAGEADRLELSLEEHRMGIDTRVRVWANTSAVNGFLPQRIVEFARLEPSVRIDLEEEFSDAIVRAVTDGRAEIGIFAGTTPTWSLQTTVCDRHSLVAIALRTHPLARRRKVRFEELLDHDFVGLTRGTALQLQVAAEAARLNKPLRLRVQVRSYDAVCKIVAVGLGVSLVPEQVGRLLAAPLGLATIALDEPWVDRQLVAAVRTLTDLSPAGRAFHRLITGA
ncbi:MAG: LysR substrate-binding domain-containing protein [Lautropia sp.]